MIRASIARSSLIGKRRLYSMRTGSSQYLALLPPPSIWTCRGSRRSALTIPLANSQDDGETSGIFSNSSFVGKEMVKVRADEQLPEGVTKVKIGIAFEKG